MYVCTNSVTTAIISTKAFNNMFLYKLEFAGECKFSLVYR